MTLFVWWHTSVLHSVCSMPLNHCPPYFTVCYSGCVCDIFYCCFLWICPAFTGYIAVCFWYVASICKPWVWWINPAWRATQADTKSSCNRSSLQISHYWFWILKIFSFVSFGVFFCDALILLFVCFCMWIYMSARIVSRIYIWIKIF